MLLSIATCLQRNIPWMSWTKSLMRNLVHLNLISDLKKEIMNVKAILSKKDKEIKVMKSQVTLLQNHVSTLKHALDKRVEELEQYGRRVCLRSEGVEDKVNMEKERNLEKSYQYCKAVCEISESVLDRAHRIGPTCTDNDTGKKMQNLIVRFTTFRHRTLFYANCKKD